MIKNILVGLDGSHFAEQILSYTAELAAQLDCRVILLEVTIPPGAAVEPLTGYFRSTSLEKILRQEDEAEAYLKQIARKLRKTGLKVSTLTVPGDPGETILRTAEEKKVDLIVLSTHGRSGLRRLVFGSVAEHVLKHSTLPILLRKPDPSPG
jgi:nucleotide-binding universal stress UspA family protein